jgi:hypothetical protein
VTILRGAVAVLVGYLFMAATAVIGGIVARDAVPETFPAAFVAVNLAFRAFGAVIGGWLAARLGATRPLLHAIALAAVVGTMAAVSASAGSPGARSGWYGPAIAAIGVGGVLLGGSLRAAAAR